MSPINFAVGNLERNITMAKELDPSPIATRVTTLAVAKVALDIEIAALDTQEGIDKLVVEEVAKLDEVLVRLPEPEPKPTSDPNQISMKAFLTYIKDYYIAQPQQVAATRKTLLGKQRDELTAQLVEAEAEAEAEAAIKPILDVEEPL
jgi:hypothetical protein